MEQTCRLCMQEHQQMIPIFEYHSHHLISELILQIIPELSLNEKEFQLSKFICQVRIKSLGFTSKLINNFTALLSNSS